MFFSVVWIYYRCSLLSVFLMNKDVYILKKIGCWLLPKKVSVCAKNDGFARVREGGCRPSSAPPGSYINACYFHMHQRKTTDREKEKNRSLWFDWKSKTIAMNEWMNEYVTYIHIAPIKQESSEALCIGQWKNETTMHHHMWARPVGANDAELDRTTLAAAAGLVLRRSLSDQSAIRLTNLVRRSATVTSPHPVERRNPFWADRRIWWTWRSAGRAV